MSLLLLFAGAGSSQAAQRVALTARVLPGRNLIGRVLLWLVGALLPVLIRGGER